MSVRVVRLGSAREADEGTRIGTVRRVPRGVPKERYASENWFDVWFPVLSPTPELMAQAKAAEMIRIIGQYRFLPASKDVMSRVGIDCGPARRPLRNLSDDERASLLAELDAIDVLAVPRRAGSAIPR